MQFPHIIDNKNNETQLEKVLNYFILPHVIDLKIAVGYFYISGFECIAETLKKHTEEAQEYPNINIILSPRTDRTTAHLLLEGSRLGRNEQSSEETIRDILRRIELDLSTCRLETMEFFLELMRSKRMDIRLCVKDFFHAKAYLAKTKEASDIVHLYSIVGSSNFSLQGLTENCELNLATEGELHYKPLYDWFDNLWKNDTTSISEHLLKIVSDGLALGKRQRVRHEKKVDLYLEPLDLFLMIVKHFLGELEEEQLKRADVLSEFQRVGTQNLMNKLERLGGALFCDSVGLGKTFTAGEIIRRYQNKGANILVITPPKLMGQWRETLRDYFHIPQNEKAVQFLSSGKLRQTANEKVKALVNNKHFDLVLLDEAHHVRNSNTNLYKNLSGLLPIREKERSHVLLLTATPLNNSIRDLRNLVSLSVRKKSLLNAGYSPDEFDTLLKFMSELKKGRKMKEIEKEPGFCESLAQVQNMLEGVMLLRMRSTIKERYKNIKIAGKPLTFHNPQVSQKLYSYPDKYRALFSALPSFLAKLHLPHIILSNPSIRSGEVLSGLFSLLLFKRIESSIYAFYCSLKNIVTKEMELLQSIEQGKDIKNLIKAYNTHRLEEEDDENDMDGYYDEEIGAEQEGVKAKTISSETLKGWIKEDLEGIDSFAGKHLKPLLENESKVMSIKDPKIDFFIENLKEERFLKCLIFTAFRDTAKYLHHSLQKACKEGKLNLRHEMVSADDPHLQEKLNRFAPKGRKVERAEAQQIDLLVSTDVLSEGLNLQDADLLINFDLPWNPMKIVQRVGRVNRIGTENQVRVMNFVPDKTLDDFLNLLKNLKSKINQIEILMGREMAILSSEDEEISIREIGAEIKKNQNARQISELEENAESSHLIFSKVKGETEEDFFCNQLYQAALDNSIRPSDFEKLSQLERKVGQERPHCCSILSQKPQSLYRLYEIYGAADSHEDLLSRYWLKADLAAKNEVSEELPTDFLALSLQKVETYLRSEIENKDEIEELETRIGKHFAEILDARKKQNAPAQLSLRLRSMKGVQNKLHSTLSELRRAREIGGVEKIFAEAVKQAKPKGKGLEYIDSLITILGQHSFSPTRFKGLSQALEERAIELGKGINPAQYKELATACIQFFQEEIMPDPNLRGYLYQGEEIKGELLFSIYM